VRSVPSGKAPRGLPSWAVAEGPFGIRLIDLAIVLLVILAIEVSVVVGSGPGAVPLNLSARLLGAALALPILFRHRWPFRVMITTAVLIFFYYIFARRNISPAPLFFVPFYDAAVAGYLVWGAAIGGGFMVTGLFVVEISTREGLAELASDFLPQIAVLALGLALGETVRSRRALAGETATRLRLAEEERAAEAGLLVAEERLRIARELHDTVAHSMATITVQAGSALHLLAGGGTGRPEIPNDPAPHPGVASSGPAADADTLRACLTAIRETSKAALTDMRSVLGQLRRSDPEDPEAGSPEPVTAAAGTGLDRLAALRDAVTAAGATVTVTIEGEQAPLSGAADHSAYRILQESLTNVLRHAGPGAAAEVCLCYGPGVLTITVTDDGAGEPQGSGGDGPGGHGGLGGTAPPQDRKDPGWSSPGGQHHHGIRGMRERAASVGGELTAGPLSGGGFQVRATLPTEAQATGDAPTARATAGVPAARGESS
jgi:signal transduction histidine kinase